MKTNATNLAVLKSMLLIPAMLGTLGAVTSVAEAASSGLKCSAAFKSKSQRATSVSTQQINGGRVFEVFPEESDVSTAPQFLRAEVAENAGSALVKLDVRLPNGHVFNLLAPRTPKDIEAKFRAAQESGDPFATNILFQNGSAAPLWPLTNRLTGKKIGPDTIEAKVMGQTVRVPLNHGRKAGQKEHHLLGLMFESAPVALASKTPGSISSLYKFDSKLDPMKSWPGKSEVKVQQGFKDGGFEFRMTTKNIGTDPIPVSSGAHPYFVAPGGDRSAVRVLIPARKLVEIDDHEYVLPTGRILPIEKNSKYDFNKPGGGTLGSNHFDNLFVDLERDSRGFVYTEFIDLKAKLRIRMTALSKNVIGVQMYSPRPELDPASGVFAALELVTALPDPREELWGSTPTGMQLLQPGETQEYGYRIELFPL